MEDIQRMASQANVPLRLVSEFNDLIAVKAAEFFVEDLKSGNVSKIRDRRRLEMLKFAPDEVTLLMTGKVWVVNWYRIPPARVTVCAVLLMLSSWGYKVLHGIWAGGLH